MRIDKDGWPESDNPDVQDVIDMVGDNTVWIPHPDSTDEVLWFYVKEDGYIKWMQIRLHSEKYPKK